MIKTCHVVDAEHSLTECMSALGYTHVDIDQANFMVYPGGADISPEIYGEAVHPQTWPSPERDLREMRAFKSAKKGAVHVGICRGAQLLCALNGGKLYQDVDGHAGHPHPVRYIREDGTMVEYTVNSLHHQMMFPTKGPVQIWATARESTYRDYSSKTKVKIYKDIGTPDNEVLWYPLSRSLCFQAHPEYDAGSTRTFFTVCLDRAVRSIEGIG